MSRNAQAAAPLADHDACYRVLRARDARFDGRFFVCVRTTGVYCRPICPARPPRPENCLFLPSAAAAQAAGFRPCLRCRPEASPETAAWRGTANTVTRAIRLIAEGALDGGDVRALAGRLGIGDRHLRRLFDRHVGASPLAVAQTRRLLFAKRLIDETTLPMTEVALAAGFRSLRRFHAVVRRTWGRPPRALRRGPAAAAGGTAVTLRLPFVPPYDWDALVAFLAARAVPGVEAVCDGVYRRTIACTAGHGVVAVRRAPGAPHLVATIRVPDTRELATVVGRLRRLFDLDADPRTIDAHLAADPRLAPLVGARPGLRVPGAWDPFELAVRAILGQQVSVAAATTLAGRLVAAHGEPLAPALADGELRAVFPGPAALAAADLRRVGLPGARAHALAAFAAAVARAPELLATAAGLDAAVGRLCALDGVGAWTAHYVAMRALREPDAFPTGDLGVARALATGDGRPGPRAVAAVAEAWRPWRAYAVLHLWLSAPAPPPRPAGTRRSGRRSRR
jgi:AraC family transcriptional regulator of adaptative response / DNA-3-methyladenine glycosylase II